MSAARLTGVRLAVLIAGALGLAGCSDRIKVEGSSCAIDEDCSAFPSCGRLVNGCTCERGTCYFDPRSQPDVTGCRGCHGSLANPAPPLSLDGGSSTDLVGVGAHQRHLSGGAWSRPVSCRECHVVPVRVDDPGHTDDDNEAEVTFGTLASLDVSPRWDVDTLTCTTYCHGGSLEGGALTTPRWTTVDGSQARCDACHGLPPGGTHPQSVQCETCHAPTAGPNLTIANRTTHIDGVVQASGAACDSCHGDPSRPAPKNASPPLDLSGNSDSPRVGAHLAHLTPASSADVACESCHRVPVDDASPGHVTDADRTAELIFSGLALADGGAEPSYDFGAQRCANTYCHGATLTGGTRASPGPTWTGAAADSACNACHGNPPPLPHPQDDGCAACHPGYSKTGPATGTTTRATHVDGHIDTNITCSTCHGAPGRDGGTDPNVAAAPPVGTSGQTATTDRAVGAHLRHLLGGALSAGEPCLTCHVVPTAMNHSDGTVRVTFGGLADAGAAAPTWSGATCAGSYCHGRFRNGNAANAPSWTGGASQAACGSCHGSASNPSPGGTHPPSAPTSCGNCHPNATGTTVDVAFHVNGVIDVINLTCTSCHGTDTRTGVPGADADQQAAPPLDTTGASAVTARGVGAHQSHLNPGAGAVSGPLSCTECHPRQTSTSHSDSLVTLTFGPLARAQSSTPAWSTSALTCTNTWCHGGNPKLTGGTATSIAWNTGATVTCVSCHGNPPPLPHPQTAQCTPCHSAGYSKTGATTGTVDLAVHVNGVIDIPGATCTSCHGNDARTSVSGADPDQPAAPPVDSSGSAATTALGVGAHVIHVNPDAGALALPFGCPECHGPTPTSTTHYDGTVDMAFGALARAQLSAPTWTRGTATCANTWCHGGNPRLPGGTRTSITWNTNATTDCTSCHGNPPPLPHPQNFICSDCHPAAYTRTGPATGTVDVPTHVNGLIDVTGLTCISCHGDGLRDPVAGADPDQQAAPPMDTLGSIDAGSLGVGAHLAHVNPDGGVALPFGCNQCHGPKPTSISHSNSVVELPFGALARAQASAPTWTRATATCANTWCHGGNPRLLGATRPSLAWNTGLTLDCVSCHGNPPPAPHPANDACGTCHPPAYGKTGPTTGTVDLPTHVNGLIDTPTLTCTSCHGDAMRASIPLADPNQQAAPPVDTWGNVLSTTRGVGQHFAHVDNAAGAVARPFGCPECHGPTPTSQSHSNAVVEMPFGPLARAQASSPSWTWDGGTGVGTCSNTWCHGGNPKLVGGTRTAIAWNTNVITDCTSCHGNPPPLPHSQNLVCNGCHANAYSRTGATTGTVDMSQHVNGLIDVTNLTCTSCHGNTGRASVSGADPNQQAAPPVDSAGSSATTSLGVGVHVGHVNPATATALARPIACAECHGAIPTSQSHSDSVVQMSFGALSRTSSSSPTWTRATATCAGTWCHGGNPAVRGGTATSPVWNNNSTVTCVSCHGNPPPRPHVQNDACGTCHTGYTKTGATTGTVNVATHIDGTVNTVTLTCTLCHGTAGRTGVPDIASAPPAGTAGETATTTRAVGAHLAHLQSGTLRGAMPCTECHATTTNQRHADGTVQLTWGTLARTRGASPVWNGSTCTTSYCHGSFPNGNAANAPTWTGGAAQAACGTCHGTLADPVPGGTHPVVAPTDACATCHPGYTRTTVDPALHLNGLVDGSGEPSTGGTSCGTCHSTTFQGMTGGVAKASKHLLGGGDVPIDPGGAWTAPLLSSALYPNATCVDMCHGDHPHDLTSPATATHQNNAHKDAQTRVQGTRTSATRASTDFDAAATNGGLCLSCHRGALDAARPGITVAAFQGGAHNYTTNARGTWTYTMHDGSTFARNCTKCHADRADGRPNDSSAPVGSVHYSDYPGLLTGTVTVGGAPSVFVCNTCHGNGTVGEDLSGKDTATDFAKALGHPVNADTRHSSIAEATVAWNDGKLSGPNRHVNCLDCHDTHEAGPTSHNRAATATSTRNTIGPASPLRGVSGVNLATMPALWGTTGASNFAWAPTASFEWQICFKCHTSYAFGASPPTGPSGLVETDLAQAFNTNNRSAHPVLVGLAAMPGQLSPAALNSSQLLPPWNVNVGTQTMMCSDCHGTDSAAPAAQGPHGSAASFMLTGANRTWPGTFTISTYASNVGTPAGNFCANCHPTSTSTNKTHGSSDHRNVRCGACHIVIPHGGKVSRLIATATAGLPARLRASGVTLNVLQYRKAVTPSGYAKGNCNTNCGTEHPTISSPESW